MKLEIKQDEATSFAILTSHISRLLLEYINISSVNSRPIWVITTTYRDRLIICIRELMHYYNNKLP